MWTLLLQLTMAFVFTKHRVASTQSASYSTTPADGGHCGDHFYACEGGGCVHELWVCDGEPDCVRGDDENNCQNATNRCHSSYFSCFLTTGCIPMSFVCDSERDCLDGSDEIDCGEERGNVSFTGVNGVITSPRFPLSYPHNSRYVYSIHVDRTKTIGLFFYSFNLEETSHDSDLDSCYYDWLLISCISTVSTRYNRSRKYCGAQTTPLLLSYTNCESFTLSFVSDSSVTGGGFKIWYSISSTGQPSCGNTSLSGPNGVITSPNFPLQYPYNFGCTYSINADRNSSVQLRFKYFNVGVPNSAGNCTHDWVKITCNETTKTNPYSNRKFCGAIQSTSSMQFVDCQSLKLQFSSGASANRAGFMIEYTVGELDCGTKLINGSSGVINLPRNPTDYSVAVNCSYTISTNRTGHIALSLYSISLSDEFLQSFQDCSTDNLTVGCVSEGGTELNPDTTRVFCRNSTSPFYYIFESELVFYDCSTLKMSIRSSTYGYYSEDAYTPSFPFSVYGPDEICGQTSFSALSGIVATQQLLFDHMRRVSCLYTIDSGHVNSVVLSIDRLNLGSEYDRSGSCSSEGWLTITCFADGGASVAHPLADRKLCGNHEPTIARFTACRSVVLNFSSDHTSYDKGITIRYKMGDYDAECGNTSFSGSTGFITSPRFPLSYPHNLNCLYSIAGGDRKVITLSFDSFRLGGISNTPSIDHCNSSDYLTVSCLSDESVVANISSMRRYCGIKTTPLTFEFPSCAAVVLNFRKDSYWHDSREGFRVRYTVIDTDSIIGGNRNQDRYRSTFLPMTPISIGGNHHHPAAVPER